MKITAKQAVFTSKFAMIWVVFFVNITAGIMFISFQSPMMQDLWSRYRSGVCTACVLCFALLRRGFGTIPAYKREVFSERLMPVVYGTILTAWSTGGVVGPQIVGFMKDNFPQNAANYAFSIGSLLLAVGFVLTLFINNSSLKIGGQRS